MTHSTFSHCGNPRVSIDLNDEDLHISAYQIGSDPHRVVDIRWGGAKLNMHAAAAADLHSKLGAALASPNAPAPNIRAVPVHPRTVPPTT